MSVENSVYNSRSLVYPQLFPIALVIIRQSASEERQRALLAFSNCIVSPICSIQPGVVTIMNYIGIEKVDKLH